jgi:hypothetical protein
MAAGLPSLLLLLLFLLLILFFFFLCCENVRRWKKFSGEESSDGQLVWVGGERERLAKCEDEEMMMMRCLCCGDRLHVTPNGIVARALSVREKRRGEK